MGSGPSRTHRSTVRPAHRSIDGKHGPNQDNPGSESHMPTKEEIRQALRNVLDPEIGKPIEDVGMLKDIVVDGGTVRVYVLLTIAGCPLKDRINNDVTQALKGLPGVERIDVVLGEMT